jgi:hypothetical protein
MQGAITKRNINHAKPKGKIGLLKANALFVIKKCFLHTSVLEYHCLMLPLTERTFNFEEISLHFSN